MIEELLRAEVTYGYPNNSFSKRQFGEMVEEKRKQFIVPKEQMQIVIAHCIYNEEQYFEECLNDDLKINDLDAIHILDGAWTHTEGEYKSTDNTVKIIDKFRKENPSIQVIYETHPNKEKWFSEPVKRNYQFDQIRSIFGDNPFYILIKDGDEMFHHTSGRQNTWIKKDLVEWIKYENNIGLINSNAWYSDISLLTPRLFPSTRKCHYYTGKSMVIHDENHNIISDYNPKVRNSGDPKLCFVYQSTILINKFTIRNKARSDLKTEFVKFIESQDGTDACEYE